MKRVYTTATVAETGAGWQVLLDGKPLRTPGRVPLATPTRALAEAIAAEWEAQGDTVIPRTMPLTQLASTALDGVSVQREAVVDAVCAYAGTDLLCYRADHPQELAGRQAAEWQPLLDWLARRYDAVLHPTVGIVHKPQPEPALRALRRAVEALDPWRLAGVQNLVGVCGSIVIALAMLEQELDADGAFSASQLDEGWQIEQWGEDAEAMARRKALREDVEATARFLRLLGA